MEICLMSLLDIYTKVLFLTYCGPFWLTANGQIDFESKVWLIKYSFRSLYVKAFTHTHFIFIEPEKFLLDLTQCYLQK